MIETYIALAEKYERPINDLMEERARLLDIIEEYGDIGVLALSMMVTPLILKMSNREHLEPSFIVGASLLPMSIQRKLTDVFRRFAASQLTIIAGIGVLSEVGK